MDILHLALNFPQLGYFSLCQPSASDICTWEKAAICAQLFKKKKKKKGIFSLGNEEISCFGAGNSNLV